MPALVPEVQVTKLVTRDVPIRQEWVGTLRGTEDAEIRSQVTGYLLSKDYKDGAYVKKGQVLSRLIPARSRQRWTRPRGAWNSMKPR